MKELFKTDSLVGKTDDEAQKICENFGYNMRIIVKDNKPYYVTCDYCINRINVEVVDGHVSVVSGIG